MATRDDSRYRGAVDIRRVSAAVCGAGLLVLAGVALVATAVSWAPCAAGLTSEACLRAIDEPHIDGVFATAWLVGVALCTAVVVLAIHASSTLSAPLTVAALVIVGVLGNPITDYLVVLVIWQDDDVALGWGFTGAVALAVGGVLVLWTAASAGRRSTPQPVPAVETLAPV